MTTAIKLRAPDPVEEFRRRADAQAASYTREELLATLQRFRAQPREVRDTVIRVTPVKYPSGQIWLSVSMGEALEIMIQMRLNDLDNNYKPERKSWP